MSISAYIKRIFIRIIPVAVIASILPLLLHYTLESSLLSTFIVILTSIMSVLIISYIVGLENNEKQIVKCKALEVYLKIKKH